MLMLRYFYLLYLLVCIESVFCYDSISDGVDLRGKRVFRKRRSLKSNRIFKRQAYEAGDSDAGTNVKGPVAAIDVASFMNNPDYDSLEENESYETGLRNRKDSSKDYSDYGTLTKLDENSQRKDKSYLEDGRQEYTLQELTSNIEHANEENAAMDKNNERARQPKKKSLAQKMKIPFFSHKKDSLQTKKNKKRKLPKNTSKKKVTVSYSLPEQSKASKRNIDIYDLNKKKRSYKEHICLICKRKFLKPVKDGTDTKNMVNNNMIHTSRQYFQALETNKDKMKQGSTNNNISEEVKEDDEAGEEKDFEDNEERTKREENDRERQLKELEEVQRKIDNVEINMPGYQKTN